MIPPKGLHAILQMVADGHPDAVKHVRPLVENCFWYQSRLRRLLNMLMRFPEEPQDPDYREAGYLDCVLWKQVANMTGLSSTSASQLCVDLGFDPSHEKLIPEPLEEEDEDEI